MNSRSRLLIGTASSIILFSSICRAEVPSADAQEFIALFGSLCAQNIDNYENLRKDFFNQNAPKLSGKITDYFLQNSAGDVWPLPLFHSNGNMVLALPYEKKRCSVYAQKISPNDVRTAFINFALHPAAPYKVNYSSNTDTPYSPTAGGGLFSIAIGWSKAGNMPGSLVALYLDSRNPENIVAHADIVDVEMPKSRLDQAEVERDKTREIVFSKPASKLGAVDMANGKKTYLHTCAACHASGVLHAPKPGDDKLVHNVSTKGIDALAIYAIRGVSTHPPKAVYKELTDDDVRNALLYMSRIKQ